MSPCCCIPIHLCPGRFGHCSTSCSSFSRAGSMMLQALLLPCGQQGAKASVTHYFFPAPCLLVTLLFPFGLALLQRVHPPLAISRQQNHALWLNTGFFKSLIPIFLGVFFHASLSVIINTGKQGTQGVCSSTVLVSNLIYLQSRSPGPPSPSSLKTGLSLTFVITCSTILSSVQCEARKSFSTT